MESKDSVNALRNAVILCKMLASINPDVLQSVVSAVDATLSSERKQAFEPLDLFTVLAQFRRRIALTNRFREAPGIANRAERRSSATTHRAQHHRLRRK